MESLPNRASDAGPDNKEQPESFTNCLEWASDCIDGARKRYGNPLFNRRSVVSQLDAAQQWLDRARKELL